MLKSVRGAIPFLAVAFGTLACDVSQKSATTDTVAKDTTALTVAERMEKYAWVTLTTDTTILTAKERQMIPLLIEAAQQMDTIYWMQTWGNRDSLMQMARDVGLRQLVDVNYGPWDRLDNNAPFVKGVGPRPAGGNLYPRDLTKEQFDSAVAKPDVGDRAAGPHSHGDSLKNQYMLVRRDSSGGLIAIPYHVAFKAQNATAAAKLRAAAALAMDAGLKRYLTLRADALGTDNYQPSDLAWLDMKSNTLDIVIGPIESYEDELEGYKTANEAYVLVKDKTWSKRLARYAAMLPALQKGLPVAEAYKKETPGTNSDLNAYDAIFYAGEANAGAKTIAINLPNDEQVQLKKGTRRLQLKNVMQAKFDKIMMPIAQELIATDQLPYLNFNAFFENTMFHEVAHGLGIKNTINGKGTVRGALKERFSAVEEGKADILGLHMVQVLNSRGDLPGEDVRGNYVSFMASLMRSTRFGGADAHGRANIAAFNYLQQMGAFTRDSASARYRVDFPRFQAAMDSLSNKILTIQGNGDYAALGAFQDQYGKITPELQRDLDRLKAKRIPVDLLFQQGPAAVAGPLKQ